LGGFVDEEKDVGGVVFGDFDGGACGVVGMWRRQSIAWEMGANAGAGS